MPTETVNWIGALLSGKRYEVTSKLGEGGMGIVYRAHDLHLHSDVVIKVPRLAMLQDPDFAGRFEREVRSLVRLVHPHIVKVSDVGKFNEIPFAVMQYLAGGSLRHRQNLDADGKGEPRPLAELRQWLAEVAAALDYIHGQHYIHRDVKPDNILFDAHGSVYLSDFGIAKVMADTPQKEKRTVLTNAGMVLGTAPYMAPEVLLGQAYDGRADQYALAVSVYQMVSGILPFDGTTPGAILMQLNNHPQPLHQRLGNLPKALSAVVQKALHRDPAQRYPTCAAFAETVLAVVLEKPLVGQAVTLRGGKNPAAPPKPPGATCPLCEKKFNLAPELRGKRVRCPNCSGIFIPKRLDDSSAKVETGNVSGSLTIPLPAPAKSSWRIPPGVKQWAEKNRTALLWGGIPAGLGLVILLMFAALGGFSSRDEKKNDDPRVVDNRNKVDPGRDPEKVGGGKLASDGPKKDNENKPNPPGENPEIDVDASAKLTYSIGTYFGVGVLAGSSKLTASEHGTTNSTLLKVDDGIAEFGVKEDVRGMFLSHKPPLSKDTGWEEYEPALHTIWDYSVDVGKIRLTQKCAIMPSKQPVKVDPKGREKRLLDTVLVRYMIENNDTRPHRVALRTLVDNYVGEKDGAPFAVPGEDHLVQEKWDGTDEQVPMFIQAIEKSNNLRNPGVVSQFTFRLADVGGKTMEPPSRVSITKFPGFIPLDKRFPKGGPKHSWLIPVERFGNDSAVVM